MNANLNNQIETIKRDQIKDLKQSNNLLEHVIAFEPLSLGSQELLARQVQINESRISILQMQIEDSLRGMIYNICNPGRSVANG